MKKDLTTYEAVQFITFTIDKKMYYLEKGKTAELPSDNTQVKCLVHKGYLKLKK